MAAQHRPPRPAILFPGMGPTQYPDLARFLLVNRQARELTRQADEVLGYRLLDRFRTEPGDYTEYAQVAFLVTCLALARWAEQEYGTVPEVLAGPSFGGKAAAVHSGALDVADGIVLTARWARCLEEYFALEHTDLVTHSFTRTAPEAIATLRAELDAAGQWHEVTCEVDQDFVMLTLAESRIEWLTQRIRALGGLPLYTMRPPMHATVFGALRAKAEAEVFDGLRFAEPRIAVVADHDGTLRTTAAGVRDMLLDGFVRPVRWPAVVEALRAQDVGTLYVAGPDVLFGRVRVTKSAFEVVPVDPRSALTPRKSAAAPTAA